MNPQSTGVDAGKLSTAGPHRVWILWKGWQLAESQACKSSSASGPTMSQRPQELSTAVNKTVDIDYSGGSGPSTTCAGRVAPRHPASTHFSKGIQARDFGRLQ
ncbi:hypothetical protein GCM10022377_20150 [Zhihengliuella alba]|uniref:Uncharacterized protein n=1 Tax=Zhihengliuella alba TaxID=547018 RepID=A0ABP7DJ38_9MICC